ncbi:hypothetical protein [Anaeromyxobacter sp. Fw109-5]|uniref:hypothetical protein n=1 Tax=Anaeromyxobacter sp. (strain Fw109-5) TaxID=404589 RepID=UPI000158A817|nr:hypothetical protein [Anaeromyxobacter sp. Fw109-5]ABS28140.1 conserved hypothetical protein [Anaeromyxobacter sp. Fw109-5]
MKTVVVAALVVLAAGCAREHLTETHGKSMRESFAVQRANPDAPRRGPPPKALTGLDSQEATIIAETYRKSLAPEGTAVEEPEVLLIAPPQSTRQRPQALPPSVPPSR